MTYIPSFTTCRHSGGLQHVGVIHFRFSLAKCQHTQHWSSVRLFSVQLCAVPIKFGCENWNSFDETNLDGLGWSSKNWPAKTFKNPNGNRLSDYRKGWGRQFLCRFTSKVALPAEMQSGAEVIHGHPWSSRPKLIRKSMVALWYLLVICYRLLLKMAIEIVDLPIKNADFP